MTGVFLGKGDDEMVHGFQSLDDGTPRPMPLCGSTVRVLGDSGDLGDEPVCERCIPLIESELGLLPGSLDD